MYDVLDGNLRDVFRRAFAEGLQQCPWLCGHENNYDWFCPRPETLVDVLYALIPFPQDEVVAHAVTRAGSA